MLNSTPLYSVEASYVHYMYTYVQCVDACAGSHMTLCMYMYVPLHKTTSVYAAVGAARDCCAEMFNQSTCAYKLFMNYLWKLFCRLCMCVCVC